MSTFKFKLEFTGLKIEVEGDRPEVQERVVTDVAKAVAGVAGMLETRAAVSSGLNSSRVEEPRVIPAEVLHSEPERSARSSRSRSRSRSPRADRSTLASWRHEPSKWGMPHETWRPWKKVMWFLHVASHELKAEELSTADIAEIFNEMFGKSAGPLTTKNLPRDMSGCEGRVMNRDGKWYLTDVGKKDAEALVEATRQAARTPASAGN